MKTTTGILIAVLLNLAACGKSEETKPEAAPAAKAQPQPQRNDALTHFEVYKPAPSTYKPPKF